MYRNPVHLLKGGTYDRAQISVWKKWQEASGYGKIYIQIDNGRSIDDIAKEWGVSRSTLYRRHREYQAEVAALKHKNSLDLDLPPLPK